MVVVALAMTRSTPNDGQPRNASSPATMPKSIGSVAAEIVASLRFRRKVERVHSLGPRVTAELLAELGAEWNIRTIIDSKLERYAGLDRAAVHATGGDDFWPVPLTETRP